MDLDSIDPAILTVYDFLDLAGVLLMGIIGGTIARQKGYDIVGFLIIAMVSALGGGMLRDVLINQGTVAAMNQPEYLILAFTGALIARFTYFKGRTWEIFRSHGDALISALWASVGAFKAITYGLPVMPTILMGVLTATGGGMIRDVLTGQEPTVFGDNQPTVIPAIAGAVVTLIGADTGLMGLGAILGPLISFSLFLIFYYRNWKLPVNTEFAPVNSTLSHVSDLAKRARARASREAEQDRERLRRSVRRALRRRVESKVEQGTQRQEAEDSAREVLDALTEEFAAVSVPQKEPEPEEDGIGFDFGGDSYDEPETTTEPAQEEDNDTLRREMLDLILSDEELSDELIARLEERLDHKRNDN